MPSTWGFHSLFFIFDRKTGWSINLIVRDVWHMEHHCAPPLVFRFLCNFLDCTSSFNLGSLRLGLATVILILLAIFFLISML